MSPSHGSNPLATHFGGADMEHGGADMRGTENAESLAESEKKKEASMDNTKALPMSPSRGSNPLATHLGGADMEHGGADMLGTEIVESLAESEKKEASVDNAESSQETALKEVEELGIFNPTDLAAITYLVKKIRGQELPRNAVVNEVNLYKSDPQTLTEDYKSSKQGDNWYFFTRTCTSRFTLNGFWKYGSSIGIDNPDGREIGRRRSYYYFLGKQSKKDDQIHTGWGMQEYIAEKGSNEIGTKYEGYALCKVFRITPRTRGKEEENKSKKLRRYEPSLAQNLSIHQNSDNPTEDRDNSVKFHDFLPVNTDSSDTKCHSGVEEQQREDHEDHEEEQGEDDNADWDNSVEFHDFLKVNTDSIGRKHHSGVEQQRGEDHEDHEERGEDDNADRDNSVQFHDFLKVNTDSSDTKRHYGVEEQRREDHEDQEEERGEDHEYHEEKRSTMPFIDFMGVDRKVHEDQEEKRGEDDNADGDNSVQFHDFLKVNTDSSDTKRHSGVEEQRREDHEDQEERGEDHEYHEEKRSTMPFIDFMGVDREVHEDNDEKAS